MKRGKMDLRTSLYLVSAVILLAGLAGGAMIYLHAASEPDEDAGYQVVGGFIYPPGGVNSKKYTHDLQLYGGNAAVLADEFTTWFRGLWQGTSLAYSVAVIAAFVSFVFFIVARNTRDPFKTGP